MLRTATLLMAIATAASAQVEWTFDEGLNGRSGETVLAPTERPGTAEQPEGVFGKALTVSPRAPVTYSVSSDFMRECALSFYYKLPPAPEKDGHQKVVILRLGDQVLTYELHKRLFFYTQTAAAKRPNGVALHRDQLRDDEYVLIELGWAPDQPSYIFIRGIASTWMRGLVASEATDSAVPLTLVEGTFDEMRLEPTVEASGARYRGVLRRLDFEAEEFDSYLLFRNRHRWKDKLHRIPGHNGSDGALKTDEAEGRHISVSLFLGYFRVTEEMYLCGAYRASNGNATRTFVRTYPRKLEHHPNYWLRTRIPKDKWHVEKTPLSRWGLKPGHLAEGVTFGSGGRGRRHLAADNVTLVRGRDTVLPDKVARLTAEETETGGVRLEWRPAQDNVCTAGYAVYWSNVPKMTLDDDEIVGRTLDTTFTHEMITHAGTYYYAVAAVDVFGNVGPAADPVRVEATE